MSGAVQKSHRDMYKARTPPWKDTYRKRCLDRLRESRDKLKAKFRKLPTMTNNDMFIEELMKAEWDSLRKEHEKNSYEMDIEVGGSLDFNIDQILDMFEDIQSELRQEEIKMLEEYSNYEESLQLEEESLCSAIDKLCTEEVVCPLCKKNTLLTNKSVIFCKCGLRINTEQDCLTLSNVQHMLDLGLEQHGEKCECEPVFNIVVETATSNLLMTCPRCLDRLRESRDKLKAKFRKLPTLTNNDMFIEELMKAEWDSLRKEHEKNSYEMDIEVGGSLDFNIDQILDMFEDIQSELRQEEIKMLEEYSNYEESLQLEEESLCSAINKLCTEEVVCPLCKKNTLLTNKSVIFCKCGLRINTEQDCLTLSNVQHMLDLGLEQHSEKCECEPVFNVVVETATSNLLMTCPRCLDRLRESRDKLKAKFRKLPTLTNNDMFIEELMKAEWDSLRKEHEKNSYEMDIEVGGSLDFNIDQILDMFEDIQSELRQEEIKMLEEYSNYEESLQLEEESLCSAIDKLCTEEVVCPLCKKNTLLTNKSVIFCKCGLRINTEQDCLTLSNVQHMLDLGLEQHSEKCECEPVFNVVVETATSNLLMTCPRCSDRLRESRDKLKAKFRKLPTMTNNDMFIEELMKAEWDSLRKEHEKNSYEMDIEVSGSLDFNIDQILDMFEDIQSELRQEEIKMLKEYSNYEESLQLEEESLCSAIDKLCTEEVVCPLCKKNTLLTNKSVIFCKCGLRINTEQDCLTLSNVQHMLDLGLEQHSEKCEPVFNVVVETGTSNLLMTCPDCDWMSVVI